METKLKRVFSDNCLNSHYCVLLGPNYIMKKNCLSKVASRQMNHICIVRSQWHKIKKNYPEVLKGKLKNVFSAAISLDVTTLDQQ